MSRTKIGIIGTGNNSPIYIEVCQSLAMLDLVACADLNLERTRRVAEVYGIARVYGVTSYYQMIRLSGWPGVTGLHFLSG